MSVYVHDPDAVLDYTFDWSEWLTTGETITSHTLTASTGLAIDSESAGGATVTAWLSTNDTTGRRNLACKITTSEGRTDERTAQINVQER